ncbi:MAG: tetratricopeptide repeat protein, partial [Candidatus Hatepunaea meridiana]|nr:tetratricopeptide repeat protein [Candidatus Hatepunaea meridiana]
MNHLALLWLLLTITLQPVTQVSYAFKLFGSNEKASRALELLPDDLQNRWIKLNDQADSVGIDEHIIDGERIIAQLGKLVDIVGGQIPQKGDVNYPVYIRTINELTELLDQIEMAAIIINADDAKLLELRSEYESEKNNLKESIRKDRQELIKLGNKRLKEQLNDPDYRNDHVRRSIIADLYFRLAELMYQEAEEEFGDELDIYMDKLNELIETNQAEAGNLNLKQPVKDFSKVLYMYQCIIDQFPDTQYGVDALYNIALLLSEMDDPNDKETSKDYLETLVTLYPGNKYTLNALRRIADYYFTRSDKIERSIEVYKRIEEEYSDTPDYVETLYKLGWGYYRISDLSNAAEYFAKTLDMDYEEDGTKKPKSTIKDFSPDALRYLGICFSVDPREWDQVGVNGLVTWLEERPIRSKNYGREVFITLGNIFADDRGQYVEGVQAYEKFIELFPLDHRAPYYHQKIVDVFMEGNIYDPARAVVETENFYKAYNPDSEWWAMNTDPKIRNAIIPVLEKYLNMIVNEMLNVGYDNKDSEILGQFENYARQYLRFWPAGPNAYTIHYNLGYILFRNLNRPTEAMREYWQVATAYEDTTEMETACETVVRISMDFAVQERAGKIYVNDEGDILDVSEKPIVQEIPELETEIPEIVKTEVIDTSSISEEAITDTTISISEELALADTTEVSEEEVVSAEVEKEKKKEESKINRTPLLNSERIELSAFDLYLKHFPNGKVIENMMYEAGSFLHEHDWIPESRPYLERYIAEFSTGKFIVDAYSRLLDGYFRSDDLAGVEEITARIQAADVTQELKDAAYERKAVTIFNNAKRLVESEDHIAAADEFLRNALATPGWDKADYTLFLAAQEYAKGGAFEKSNDAYLMLVEKYPNSERADKALMNTAYNYQNELKQLDKAAETFERLTREYPNSSLVQDALANASYNYDKVEDHLSVIRLNERFLSLYPDDPEANIYLFEMAGHWLALDNFENANSIYLRFAQRYPNDPRTVRAYYERADYYLGKFNLSQASQEFRATIEAHDKQVEMGNPGESRYASRSLAKLLEWEHEEYNKLRFRLPISNLKATIDRKKQWRDSLIERYRKLISYSQKEAWQAYYAMGRLVEDQTVAVYEQEIPHIPIQDSMFVYIDAVVDESIILNQATIAMFKDGYTWLDTIKIQLTDFQRKTQEEISKLKDFIAQTQQEMASVELDTIISDTLRIALSDSLAGVVADSSGKFKRMEESLKELDVSISEADKWYKACRERIPEIVVRNGDYLTRAFEKKFEYYNTEQIEENRLLFQEEVLKKVLTPAAPEVCGLYLQAIDVIEETNVNVDIWIGYIEQRCTQIIDTLLIQWDSQFEVSQRRIEQYKREYDEMLPEGEYAESSEGYYIDMMGGFILNWTDYLTVHNMDKLNAFTAILDTIVQYDLPVGFGEEVLEKPLLDVLEYFKIFNNYSEDAKLRQEKYAREYEQNGFYWDEEIEEEVEAYWWDDASVAYEDAAVSFSDYGFSLLEEGHRIHVDYNLTGMAGINILRLMVELKPDVYANKVGIEPQHFTLVSSSDWKIWPIYENEFQLIDFDDSEWQPVHITSFPAGSDFGILDSLGATPIWYTMSAPAVPPKWLEYEDSYTGFEGNLFEFTLSGDAPERSTPKEKKVIESEEPDTVETVETIETVVPSAQLRIEYYSDDLPGEVEFTDLGNGKGSFIWTPSFDDAGEYNARFILYNYQIPLPLSVSISIENVDRSFTWSDIPFSINTEEGMVVKFLVVGLDPDGDPLTISYDPMNLPDAAEFIIDEDGSGLFTWETTYDDSGSYTALFTLSDGENEIERNVPIQIENSVRAPKFFDYPDSISVNEGTIIEFTVAGSSPDEVPLSLSDMSFDIPDAAEFTDQSDGSGIFRWETTYDDAGSYTLILDMSSEDTTVTLEVPIIIANTMRAPVLIDFPQEPINVEEGGLVEFSIAGEHPDGLLFTIDYFSTDILETAVVFNDYDDGTASFKWQTAIGNEGVYTASFALSDQDSTTIGDVQIIIGGAALPPGWSDIPIEVSDDAGSLIEFTIIGSDPKDQSLTIEYSSEDLPEVIQFTDNNDGTGSFIWQTTSDDAGSYTARFILSNGELTTSGEVRIIVIGSVLPPEWLDFQTEVTIDAGDLIELPLSGTDPGGLELIISYHSDNISEAAQFTDNTDGTGLFTWQTTSDDAGSYTASFDLSNGELSTS